jgi:hypothetical protein
MRSRRRASAVVPSAELDEEVYTVDAARFRTLLESKRAGLAQAEAHIHVLSGSQFSLEWVQRHGITKPIKILDRAGMGMRIPAPSFTVRDVADCVGRSKNIDIIDVAAQHEIHGWTLGDWADYFHKRSLRRAVLNVISLEFSGTRLEPLVRAPSVVRQVRRCLMFARVSLDYVPFRINGLSSFFRFVDTSDRLDRHGVARHSSRERAVPTGAAVLPHVSR